MEGKTDKIGKHCCPNPNCGKIFSRPKVIKYYVCPSCQTLIDIPAQEIPDPTPPIKKPDLFAGEQEPKSELTLNLPASDVELAPSKENANNETPDLKLEFITESKSIDTSSLEEKVQLAVEGRKELSELNFQCEHYFGFLSEKKQGQEIPETCFECPKSVECLLSKRIKSEESIQEIKQWYTTNSQ
ncbi:MAG TPA: hypothetical protein VK253_02000 [Candidatus Binatia bacterium]|nr:hypothetical protein [Candidatus Binatia bacterium]